VRNLFDASYREPLSFIPEPGRTFALSLRRSFDFTPFSREQKAQ
jgi:outer membrane receptor protein involved in Fe transport